MRKQGRPLLLGLLSYTAWISEHGTEFGVKIKKRHCISYMNWAVVVPSCLS